MVSKATVLLDRQTARSVRNMRRPSLFTPMVTDRVVFASRVAASRISAPNSTPPNYRPSTLAWGTIQFQNPRNGDWKRSRVIKTARLWVQQRTITTTSPTNTEKLRHPLPPRIFHGERNQLPDPRPRSRPFLPTTHPPPPPHHPLRLLDPRPGRAPSRSRPRRRHPPLRPLPRPLPFLPPHGRRCPLRLGRPPPGQPGRCRGRQPAPRVRLHHDGTRPLAVYGGLCEEQGGCRREGVHARGCEWVVVGGGAGREGLLCGVEGCGGGWGGGAAGGGEGGVRDLGHGVFFPWGVSGRPDLLIVFSRCVWRVRVLLWSRNV